jgi:hypothetical protein
MPQVIIELTDLDTTPKVTNRGQYVLQVRAEAWGELTHIRPGATVDLPISESNGSLVELHEPEE